MHGFSIRWCCDPGVEVGAMSLAVPVSEEVKQELARPLREGLRFESDTRRDDARYERAWFADFRDDWRKALAAERLNFVARLEAI